MRQDVEKHAHKVEIVTRDVGHLKDGTYTARYKLGCSVYAVFSILDGNGDLACTGRFEDFGELGNGLFEDLWWANINFSDDDHDRHVECKCNTEMLSEYSQ